VTPVATREWIVPGAHKTGDEGGSASRVDTVALRG